jgi:4-oxalocrotonate tautomerase family enzyme
MWAGRTVEQKKELARDITQAFEKQGLPAEAVQIIMKDNPKENWAHGGRLVSENL